MGLVFTAGGHTHSLRFCGFVNQMLAQGVKGKKPCFVLMHICVKPSFVCYQTHLDKRKINADVLSEMFLLQGGW